MYASFGFAYIAFTMDRPLSLAPHDLQMTRADGGLQQHVLRRRTSAIRPLCSSLAIQHQRDVSRNRHVLRSAVFTGPLRETAGSAWGIWSSGPSCAERHPPSSGASKTAMKSTRRDRSRGSAVLTRSFNQDSRTRSQAAAR